MDPALTVDVCEEEWLLILTNHGCGDTDFLSFRWELHSASLLSRQILGKAPSPKSLQPLLQQSSVAVYVYCFLSPKQFLNSTNYHKSLPGHGKFGKLAQLPAEGGTGSAHAPLSVFTVLPSSIEYRSSRGHPHSARGTLRHQGYTEGYDMVPFLQDLECGRGTETEQKGLVQQTKFHRKEWHRERSDLLFGFENSHMEGQAKGGKGILKRENSTCKGIYLICSDSVNRL